MTSGRCQASSLLSDDFALKGDGSSIGIAIFGAHQLVESGIINRHLLLLQICSTKRARKATPTKVAARLNWKQYVETYNATIDSD